jgi:hypothetical protein
MTMTMTMTAEEAARRWLNEQALYAVSLAVIYRDYGDKRLVFDAQRPTWIME